MTPLPLGATIGIVGAGQLGRMSAAAAARLGFRTHILSPEPDAPALALAHGATIGPYDDPDTLRAFAARVDVVTFEFENVSADGLALLSSLRPVRPSGEVLRISQDRIEEKSFLERIGLRVAPWREVRSPADLATLETPVILKTTRLGYDGRGQFHLHAPEDLAALDADTLPYPLIAEGRVDFACEISVMVARGLDGDLRCFDVTENRHVGGILDLSVAPARIPQPIAERAREIARHVAEKLELVGILGCEMFVDARGEVLVNEIAPRPHNSGHWTLDGCLCDQFEMHVRAVAGLPLPSPVRHSDAAMRNLIGPEGMALVPEILTAPDLALHLYGKPDARPDRKMGHVTALFPRGALPGDVGVSERFRF